MNPVKAIILAGGELESCFKEHGESAFNKAFIKIHGKFMVEYVIEALKDTDVVEEIILAVPSNRDLPFLKEKVTVINSGNNVVETVMNGVKYIPEAASKVLLVMSDLPLLVPEAIKDFLIRCNEIEGDYYYSILTKDVSEKSFPEFAHTYIKLKDGIFCGGGLILLDPKICTTYRADLMNKMTQARKNPWEMAKILGTKTLLKLASGQVTRKDLEERTSTVFKCKARSINTPYAEIGINVDKPKQLELIRSIISSTKNNVGR